MATQSQISSGYGLNVGYRFYESLEDIDKEKQQHKKLLSIKECLSKMSVDDSRLDAVYALLFNEVNQNDVNVE